MRRAWPLPLVVVVAVAGAGAAGCGPYDVTASRLDAAVTTTFANLYAYQQQLLGGAGAAPADVSASCSKSGGGAQLGAGDGWTCTVDLVPAGGVLQSITYDMSVQADGCFHAEGPPGIVGTATERTADGRTRTNPLFAFDGCFDTT